MGFSESLSLLGSSVLNSLTRGSIIKKDHLDGRSVGIRFDTIFTRRSYKKVFNIFEFPRDYDNDLESLLFETIYTDFPKVEFRFVDMGIPRKLEIQKDGVRQDYSRAVEDYAYYKEMFDKLSTSGKKLGSVLREGPKILRLNKGFVDRLADVAESYDYLYEYSATGGFSIYYKHLELSCPDRDLLGKACDKIMAIIEREGCVAQILSDELGDYLKNFSPSGLRLNSNSQSVGMLFSDENIAYQTCRGECGISDTTGVYSGVNVKNHAPQNIDHTHTVGCDVTGVMGMAGSGKSSFSKNKVGGFLASELYHVSIMEYKGTDYPYWLTVFPTGQEIKLGKKYVNFMNISRIPKEYNHEDRLYYFDASISGTVHMFEAICNLKENEGSVSVLEKWVSKAMTKVFDRAHISRDDTYSYIFSKGLVYNDILEIMRKWAELPNTTETDRDMLRLIVSRCDDYFASSGSKAYIFTEEIDLLSILESRLVIFNFEKNAKSTDFGVDDNIKFTMMSFLNDAKTVYLKKLNLYNVLIYEELQRSGDGFILRRINQDVTGGRSDNKIPFLVFNSFGFLLSGSKDARNVLGNINNWYIGKLSKAEYDTFKANVDTSEFVDKIDEIRSDQVKYDKCFACLVDDGKTIESYILKVELPQAVLDSDLFHTKDTEDDIGKDRSLPGLKKVG